MRSCCVTQGVQPALCDDIEGWDRGRVGDGREMGHSNCRFKVHNLMN